MHSRNEKFDMKFDFYANRTSESDSPLQKSNKKGTTASASPAPPLQGPFDYPI
jgi:hypothetical protein